MRGKISRTRLWNIERGETAVMRSKKEAHDYRYFGLIWVPLKLDDEWIKDSVPTCPDCGRADEAICVGLWVA